MRIHHLNCGTCCPVGGRLFDGRTDALQARLVCHCLLIETDAGLVLVDTGYGRREAQAPRPRLSPFFLALNQPQLRPAESAVEQVRALGFDPADVRHILITHLDFDHAGGLADFPQATVHLTAREHEAAEHRAGGLLVGEGRYRPVQWRDVNRWRLYPPAAGEAWHGFAAVRDLAGLPPEILLVPLAGHTHGHSGVAVRRDGGDWLLHAGDAYFHHGEIGGAYHCPPGLRAYQALMEVDRAARRDNQARLRRLAAAPGAPRIFCAHDRLEFELLAGAGA